MTCMPERRGACSVLVGTPEGRPGLLWRIILKRKTIAVSARSKV